MTFTQLGRKGRATPKIDISRLLRQTTGLKKNESTGPVGDHSSMTYIIGVDEAGYGPNLGPLVIAATAWEIADDSWTDLFTRVSPEIARPADRSADTWLVVGDSKQLYTPQKGLGPLESAVQSLLAESSQCASDDLELFTMLCREPGSFECNLPWYQTSARSLPHPTPSNVAESPPHSSPLNQCLLNAGIRFHGASTQILEPDHFNSRCRESGNKATVLSEESIALLHRMIQQLPGRPKSIWCQCDRHGGRTRYGALLQAQFNETFVEVHGETSEQSTYRWGPENCRVEVRFSPGGERHWEVAWASMLAKYVRELAMERFNQFWKSHIDDLKPTRGYPVDAKRFRQDIEPIRERLKIPIDHLWRER